MSAISDIHDLVAAVELEEIAVYEERARRVRVDERIDEGEPPAPEVKMGVRQEAKTLHYRFRMVLLDASAEYVADFEIVYSVDQEEPLSLPDELLQEFASKVAFMAVYPFLRASVFGSATRLGNSRPILPIVRLGDFSSGERMSDEEIQAAFNDDSSELAPRESQI